MEAQWRYGQSNDPRYKDVKLLMNINAGVISAQEAVGVIIKYTLNYDPVNMGGALDRIFEEAEYLNTQLDEIQEKLHSLRSYIEANIRNGDE